jgi:hypothetical protein
MKHLCKASGIGLRCLACLLVPLAAGCGKVELGRVAGKVLLDGRPLDNVQVEFIPEVDKKSKPQPVSLGSTDAEGRYTLAAADGRPGAAVGEHMIVVHDLQLPAGARLAGRADADKASDLPPAPADVERVAKAYRTAGTTPLRKRVQPGEQTIDLELRANP